MSVSVPVPTSVRVSVSRYLDLYQWIPDLKSIYHFPRKLFFFVFTFTGLSLGAVLRPELIKVIVHSGCPVMCVGIIQVTASQIQEGQSRSFSAAVRPEGRSWWSVVVRGASRREPQPAITMHGRVVALVLDGL